MTESLFRALRTSLVYFSRSRDASNSENCSIKCARSRTFRKLSITKIEILHRNYHSITVGHLYRCEIL